MADAPRRLEQTPGPVVAIMAVVVALPPGPTGALLMLTTAMLAWSWYEERHAGAAASAQPADRTRARRRLVVVPALVAAAAVAGHAAFRGAVLAKEAGFVWDALPPHTVDGTTYAWPGLYGTDLLGPADWYATGGPYVPLPSDSPATAAARVAAYLRDRFDLRTDAAELETVLARLRDAPPPERLAQGGGAAPHPYTAGLAAIETRYEGAARLVLGQRLGAAALALSLVGCLTVWLGVAVRSPAAWKIRRVGAAVAAVALAATLLLVPEGADAWGLRVALPVARLHAEHPTLATTAVLLVCAALLAAAWQRAATPSRACGAATA